MIYKKIILENNSKIWFTSDSHYNHKNICKGVTAWDLDAHGGEGSVRDFKTLDQMNQTIVDGINNHVGQDDYLIHLGDWSFGGIESIWDFRKRIICKNITFILGNHDHHIANDRALTNEDLNSFGDGEVGFLTYAQSIFDSVHSYLELVVSSAQDGKRTYNLMHFPIAVWNKAHHNRIMLHGHCHAHFQHEGRSLDVGVDKAFELFGEYRPFSQDDIDRFMKNRGFFQQDHHNKEVN